MTTRRKPSGLPWADTIPDRWDSAKVCLVARLESGHTPSRQHPEYWVPEECTIPWFSLADVWQLREANQKYLGDTAENVSPLGIAHSAARVLPAGTVVLSRTASVGFAGIMPRPMATTQDFANWVCGPRVIPEYLLWAFRAMKPEFARLMMGSTHQTIYMPDIRRLAVPVPPVSEQRAISEFLDHRTAIVDALIDTKERLAETLAEKRQAIITQFVTKGCEPEPQMSNSGVKWLGEVPSHWEVLPLRRVVDQFVDYRGRTPTKVDDGIPLITAGAVRDGTIDHKRAPEYMAPEEYDEFMRRGLPRKGDLVFTTEAPLGEVALVEDPSVAFAQRIILFRVNRSRILSEYLHLYFLSTAGRADVESRASGSTAEGIRADRLRASAVLVPPLPEQARIVEAVAKGTRIIEPLRAHIRSSLDTLREYRQAFITAAVTGQLDVAAQEAA